MRIRNSETLKKCVGFVCWKDQDGVHVGGTCFIIGIDLGVAGQSSVYIVTARHVIEAIEKYGIDGRVHLRLNGKDGTVWTADVELNHWKFHPEDEAIDVAAINWGLPQEVIDYKMLPIELLVTDQTLEDEGITVGDEVFITGLFVKHYGKRRNLPIIRIGNIAMMPDEPLPTKHGDMDGYLIEVRSIGGLSGSPVFVHLPLHVYTQDATGEIARIQPPRFHLLGLIHGHWDIGEDEIEFADNAPGKAMLNTGMAVSVPAAKILEVINQECFVKNREQQRKEMLDKDAPTDDATEQVDGGVG